MGIDQLMDHDQIQLGSLAPRLSPLTEGRPPWWVRGHAAPSGQGSDVAGETAPGHEHNLPNQKSIASCHRPLCMRVNSGTIRDDS